jgi:NAD(P)-dependent dehydrogenase (short-subunit alcohol dehydrogenase family)
MGKVVVITGGGRGIGAVTAELLAHRGWDVCISYRANADAAGAVVDACLGHGGRAVAVRADVAVEADVVTLFERCDAELGSLDALVNNAAIVAPKARVAEISADRLQRLMAVNVIGAFLCAREAVRRMSTAHGGSGGVIVNISSAASRIGSPKEYVDYAATKGAIDSMTLGLAKEVAGEGIRVNAVRPGIIDTSMHASGGQPDRVSRLGPQTPMGRAGEPAEIAAAIAWLCSDEASYATGALLDVAGGR